jgi:predicted NodU family carbamoyl transferase
MNDLHVPKPASIEIWRRYVSMTNPTHTIKQMIDNPEVFKNAISRNNNLLQIFSNKILANTFACQPHHHSHAVVAHNCAKYKNAKQQLKATFGSFLFKRRSVADVSE